MALSLGQKIRALRKEKGLTLEELAKQADSSKGYIWELENKEKGRPSATKIELIAKVLDTTPQYLLNDSMATPDDSVADEAFFRRYRELDEPTKEKLNKILKVLDSTDD